MGAMVGGFTGFFVGLLALAPGTGTVLGAAMGGAVGSAADPALLDGVDRDFLKALGSNLKPETSALIVLVPDDAADAVRESISAYEDGVIAEAVVDAATELAIRDAYGKSQA